MIILVIKNISVKGEQWGNIGGVEKQENQPDHKDFKINSNF